MLLKTFNTLLLVASVSAAVVRRDDPMAGHSHGAPVPAAKGPSAPAAVPAKPAAPPKAPVYKALKVQNVKPRLRRNAKHQLIRYGPLTLPASKTGPQAPGGHAHGAHGGEAATPGAPGQPMDPNGFAFLGEFSGGMCEHCTVLAAKIDVVFENGTRGDISNGVYLHHLVTNMKGKNQPEWVTMCPGDSKVASNDPSLAGLKELQGTGFVGGAVDPFYDYFTSTDGTFDSGYYIPKGAKTSMSGEIVSYVKNEQQVYIQMDLEYLPGKVGGEAIKTPLNVEGCDFSTNAFKNGGDKGNVTSKDFTVLKDGTILLARAHMHDGGDFLSAYINGEMVCTSTAVYGGPGGTTIVDGKEWKTIAKMTECSEPIEISAGDKLKLVAGFDNIAHPLRKSDGMDQENMGFMVFTFVPSEEDAEED